MRYDVGGMVFLVVVMGVILYLLFKNNNTCAKHIIILDAIYFYDVDCINNNQEPLVTYSDMESYDSTWLRLYDWGYTRILPKDKFEIIKPYLNRKELDQND